MLPLRTKASIRGAKAKTVLKVANLEIFSRNVWPVEDLLLDARLPEISNTLGNLVGLRWGAVLSDTPIPEVLGTNISGLELPMVVQPGDVVAFGPHSQQIQTVFRRGARANSLFTTEQCNNYCLMCSQPPRAIDDSWRFEEMLRILHLMDKNLPWLGITGGEPTLLGEKLAQILDCGSSLHPATRFHVLSNGRRFASSEFTTLFEGCKRNTVWAIPLYGDCAAVHDFVVQANGAFAETVRGLYSLESRGHSIEIRVVLHRPTVSRLVELAGFISSSMPFASHIALMGMEPTGFARANRDLLWVDPADYVETLAMATNSLIDAGLNVSIYNLPLCVLPRELWQYAQDSISEWKRQHLPVCDSCSMKSKCGGFFASHSNEWQSRKIRAFHEEDLCQTSLQ